MRKVKISASLHKVLASTIAVCCAYAPAALCGDIAKAPTTKPLMSRFAKPVSKVQLNSSRRGRQLFLANQCLDCHLVAGKGCDDGVALDGIADRRTKDFLQEHLKDPEGHVARNAKAFGGDPNLMTPPNLSKAERDDVVAYLLSLTAATSESSQGKKHR